MRSSRDLNTQELSDDTIQGTLPIITSTPPTQESTLTRDIGSGLDTSDVQKDNNPINEPMNQSPCFTRDNPPPFCRSIIRYHHPHSGISSPCTSYAICNNILQAHIKRVGSWCLCLYCQEQDKEDMTTPVINIDRTDKWHITETDESNSWRKSPSYTILWLQGNQDHYRRITNNSVVTEDDHFYIIPQDLTTFLHHLRPLQEYLPLRKWCACNKSDEEALQRAAVAIACYSLREAKK